MINRGKVIRSGSLQPMNDAAVSSSHSSLRLMIPMVGSNGLSRLSNLEGTSVSSAQRV